MMSHVLLSEELTQEYVSIGLIESRRTTLATQAEDPRSSRAVARLRFPMEHDDAAHRTEDLDKRVLNSRETCMMLMPVETHGRHPKTPRPLEQHQQPSTSVLDVPHSVFDSLEAETCSPGLTFSTNAQAEISQVEMRQHHVEHSVLSTPEQTLRDLGRALQQRCSNIRSHSWESQVEVRLRGNSQY